VAVAVNVPGEVPLQIDVEPPLAVAARARLTVMVNVLASAEHLLLFVTVHFSTTVPTVPVLVKVTFGLSTKEFEKDAPAPPVAVATLQV
jgi:hypothetical protein